MSHTPPRPLGHGFQVTPEIAEQVIESLPGSPAADVATRLLDLARRDTPATIASLAAEFGAQPHEVAAFGDLGTMSQAAELDADTAQMIRDAWHSASQADDIWDEIDADPVDLTAGEIAAAADEIAAEEAAAATLTAAADLAAANEPEPDADTPDCYDCRRQWADCTCEGPQS